jgi:hypothetical protein
MSERSLTVWLPGNPAPAQVLGFEALALSPYAPRAAQLTITVLLGEQSLGSAPVSIRTSSGKQADASVSLYRTAAEESDPFQLLRFPTAATTADQEIRLVLKLETPGGDLGTPVALYLRRFHLAAP